MKLLEQLLEHAKSGRLIGIAACAMYRQRRYNICTAGECDRHPTFTLGMLRALDHKLSSRIFKQRNG